MPPLTVSQVQQLLCCHSDIICSLISDPPKHTHIYNYYLLQFRSSHALIWLSRKATSGFVTEHHVNIVDNLLVWVLTHVVGLILCFSIQSRHFFAYLVPTPFCSVINFVKIHLINHLFPTNLLQRSRGVKGLAQS